jgi:hypothetical protein
VVEDGGGKFETDMAVLVVLLLPMLLKLVFSELELSISWIEFIEFCFSYFDLSGGLGYVVAAGSGGGLSSSYFLSL